MSATAVLKPRHIWREFQFEPVHQCGPSSTTSARARNPPDSVRLVVPAGASKTPICSRGSPSVAAAASDYGARMNARVNTVRAINQNTPEDAITTPAYRKAAGIDLSPVVFINVSAVTPPDREPFNRSTVRLPNQPTNQPAACMLTTSFQRSCTR